jgi:NAD(P)-dependent dehydrogenase (short-subunit alcohol dehydrogenase family)
MDELDGKVAVVTGAASGIGLALCEHFAADGMRVVMSDLDPARLDEAATSIEGDVEAVAADVSRREDVEAIAARATERFGAVHVLCNNAGVTRPGRAWEFTREQWDWVLGVNLWGVVNGINAFVPTMIERGEPAHIVNTASVSGLIAWPGLSLYATGKYAVVGYSECLALDLRAAGAPIGVSVLCPGPTRTNFRASSRALEPGAPGDPVPDVEAEVEWQTPADVAGKVVDAIRRDRFWILSHPAYNEAIERRVHEAVTTGDLVETQFV